MRLEVRLGEGACGAYVDNFECLLLAGLLDKIGVAVR